VTDSTLVFKGQGHAGRRLVVNFGVYSGREATEAEIYRLAQSLLDELGSVEIVAERRYEVAADVEATVHQVYVEVPQTSVGQELIERLAKATPPALAGYAISGVETTDGTKLLFDDESWLLFRQSGTEPMLRIYSEATSVEKSNGLLAAGEGLARQ